MADEKVPIDIRHYAPEKDLPALSLMLGEVEVFDTDGEATSEDILLGTLEWPYYHSDRNVWVAESDGKLAALTQLSQHCTINVVIHTGLRRNRISCALRQVVTQCALETNSKSIPLNAN